MRFLLLLASILLLPVPASGSLADTVGWTGGCTLVVVHPDGWALTAEHCGHSKDGFTVEIAGRSVKAREVYDPPKNSTDEAVLVKLEGGPFRWARLATEPVKIGDRVQSWGFPAGNISYITGVMEPRTQGAPGHIQADGAAIGGHSGGPLFNARGEVCGLLSESDRASWSTWIPLSSLRAAVSRAAQHAAADDRLVWVLTSPGCLPCENLKADYARGQFPGIEMRFIDMNTTGGRELRERIRTATGEFPAFTPTLWADGASRFTTGYSGVGTLRSWLVTALRLPVTFWEVITGDRVGPDQKLLPQPESQPETEPFPSPPPKGEGLVPESTEPDYAGVRLLLFAPQTGAHDLPAKAVLALAEHAGQQLSEHTEDRARFVMVSERLTPARYAATCEAANVPLGQWQFIAMIPARSDGMRQTIRGALLGFIRDSLPESVRNAPLGLLTETGSKDAYPETVAALDTPEPPPAPTDPVEGGDPVSDDVPWYYGLTGLFTLLGNWTNGIRERLKSALEKL